MIGTEITHINKMTPKDMGQRMAATSLEVTPSPNGINSCKAMPNNTINKEIVSKISYLLFAEDCFLIRRNNFVRHSRHFKYYSNYQL